MSVCVNPPNWLVQPALAKKARAESIYLEQRFSDHAPVTIDYDFVL